MSKLTIVANPTFEAPVPIPLAGGDDVLVKMTFKHRTKTQYFEFRDGLKDKQDADSVMEMVVGWELEDALTKENVKTLLENYIGAAVSIFDTYREQLFKAKQGN